MNERIIFYPSIVWLVDEHCQAVIDAWHGTLPVELKPLVRVIAAGLDDTSEIEAAVQRFNQVSFDDEIRAAGYETAANGSRVRIAVVGYGMGQDAFSGWGQVEEKIGKFGKEVKAIESHRICVARSEEHEIEDRYLVLEGLSRAPWLLSTRGDDWKSIDKPVFGRYVGSLLSLLMLTDRNEDILGREEVLHVLGVADVDRNQGVVRVPGVLKVDVEEAFDLLVDVCLSATVTFFVERPRGGDSQLAMLRSEALRRIDRFLDGSADARDVAGWLLSERGLAGEKAGVLVTEGRTLLGEWSRHIEHRVRVASSPHKPMPVSDEERSELNLLQRIIVKVGEWLHLELVGIGEFGCGEKIPLNEENARYLKEKLDLARSVLEGIERQAEGSRGGGVKLPEDVQRRLEDGLEKELKDVLRSFGSGGAWLVKDADELTARIGARASGELVPFFLDAADWELTDPKLADAIRAVKDPKQFRFCCSERTQLSIKCKYLVSSLHASAGNAIAGPEGAQWVSMRFAEGIRPKIIGVSEPTRVAQLSW